MQNKRKENKRKKIDDDDREDCAEKLVSAVKSCQSSSQAIAFLKNFEKQDWPHVVRQVEESKYLQDNLDVMQKPAKKFIERLLNGGYKTYAASKKQPKANGTIADRYTPDELDAVAAKKREDFIRGSGQHSGAGV